MSATQKQKFLAPPLLGLNITAQGSKVLMTLIVFMIHLILALIDD